uniref:Uncharacterized protein n=1 Tax=Utricularia reniformis TaxID=192314 RepID=A0A1Y0AZ70_9LAMI|nr:hypothetical protein AEK19_MT2065 [Utricularia reniformis]ART30428.1 hypothetical protein AEK19_MT2065 [Utricularia reniformis]
MVGNQISSFSFLLVSLTLLLSFHYRSTGLTKSQIIKLFVLSGRLLLGIMNWKGQSRQIGNCYARPSLSSMLTAILSYLERSRYD